LTAVPFSLIADGLRRPEQDAKVQSWIQVHVLAVDVADIVVAALFLLVIFGDAS
jgi:hypothetical protein